MPLVLRLPENLRRPHRSAERQHLNFNVHIDRKGYCFGYVTIELAYSFHCSGCVDYGRRRPMRACADPGQYKNQCQPYLHGQVFQ